MKPILDRLRADLVERRLWPLVAVLLVALVAVPVVLREDGAAAGDEAPAVTVEPADRSLAVAARALSGDEPRRPAAGDPRDPFRQPPEPKPESEPDQPTGQSSTPAATPASSTPNPAPEPSSSSSPASPPATAPRSTVPARPTTPAKPRTHRLHRTDVRLDAAEPVRDVPRLRAFPSAARPLALYLGVVEGGKAAAFVLTSGAQVGGDGVCKPRARLCTHLLLKPGETATLTGADGVEHTLAVAGIRTATTRDERIARRFYARESRKGRCLLDVLDLLAFDPRTGTLDTHHDTGRCRYVLDAPGQVGAR